MEAITPSDPPKTKDDKTLVLVAYGLYAASFIVGITAIAAVIIGHIKIDEVRGTWLESHYRWQIRTFWWGLLWAAVGIITFLIAIGGFVLIANAIWFLYRIIKGVLRLNDNLPMPV